MSQDYIYLALLHSIGISQKYLHIIFASTQNYQEVYQHKINSSFLRSFSISQKQSELILKNYQRYSYEKLKKNLEDKWVEILTCLDEEYPKWLEHISHPPFVLYVRWTIDNSPKIAVVWSRKMTSYGEKIISNFLPDIAQYFPIVSGWAAWVDTTAHKYCMKQGSKTISVIGTGICHDYPVANGVLYDEIAQSWWCVLSIFAPYDVGQPFHFPIRNEIIVWLSQWVWVIEAQEKSWSLITAWLALDMGKDVFTCPGDVFCISSAWCNSLIRSGAAKAVLSSTDILEEYGWAIASKKNTWISAPDDPTQKSLYNYLLLEPGSIDDLSQKTLLDTATLSHTLSLMEISGYIIRQNTGVYRIK